MNWYQSLWYKIYTVHNTKPNNYIMVFIKWVMDIEESWYRLYLQFRILFLNRIINFVLFDITAFISKLFYSYNLYLSIRIIMSRCMSLLLLSFPTFNINGSVCFCTIYIAPRKKLIVLIMSRISHNTFNNKYKSKLLGMSMNKPSIQRSFYL